ncbi:MAG TPA: hypothetical protein VLV81_10305 [Acidimicrobiia bacterium]|nr:hypothetical protein [Acidimicrobiia bacterium]
MALADRHAARYRDLAQEHIPEVVLAAGYVSTAGTAKASAFGGPMSGVLGSAIGERIGRQTQEEAARAGFPPSAWLAVTTSRVYAFAAERGEVGALIGVWDRDAVTGTKAERLATTRLSLRFGTDARVQLEARRWGAGNHQLLRLLLDPTRTGP